MADDDVGVGHGRLGAALAVRSGTRLGARGLRTDAEGLRQLRHVGNRAATSADGVHVDRRHLQAELPDGRVAADRGLTVLAERHVGRRATHVEREDVRMPGTDRHREGAGNAAGRTGQDAVDRVATRLARRHQASVRAKDVDVTRGATLLQLVVKTIDVRLHLRAHERVHARGQGALVLAELRHDVRGQGDGEARVEALDDLADLLLVLVRDVRVDQANRERLDATLDEILDDPLDLLLVHGHDGLATRTHALDSLARVGEGRRRLGLLHDDPASQRARRLRACQMQDLLEALRRDQTDARALALEHGVRRNGRAVHDVAEITGRDARRLADACDTVEHTLGRVARRRRGLHPMLCSVLVIDEEQVGERATDVHS